MIDLSNRRVLTLLEAIGIPYVWGAGDLRNAKWLADGYDCSGFAQAASVKLLNLRPDAWDDIAAHELAYECDPVPIDEAEPGDLCFYGNPKKRLTHVTVALGGGMCIGANGGGRNTKGDDPKACVQVRPIKYRNDFVTVGRIKAKHRPVMG